MLKSSKGYGLGWQLHYDIVSKKVFKIQHCLQDFVFICILDHVSEGPNIYLSCKEHCLFSLTRAYKSWKWLRVTYTFMPPPPRKNLRYFLLNILAISPSLLHPHSTFKTSNNVRTSFNDYESLLSAYKVFICGK